MISTAHLQAKLHPSNFRSLSGKMAAVVSYILDAQFADPPILDITIDPDGSVLALIGGHDTAEVIGTHGDLQRNWRALLRAAHLTAQEGLEAESLYAMRVGIQGPPMA
jgi:hypothetical protein